MSDIYKRLGNSIRTDVTCGHAVYQSTALALIGTLAPKELVDIVFKDVISLAFIENPNTSLLVRKKALLCLLRILRRHKETIRINPKWSEPLLKMLDWKNQGILCAAVSLLSGIVALDSPEGYEEAPAKLITVLRRILVKKECTEDYYYYKTPNPWLQVKILKALQILPPTADYNAIQAINEVLDFILAKTQVTKSVHKNNVDYGILFEAVNVILHYGNAIDPDLRSQAVSIVGLFISVKEPNIR